MRRREFIALLGSATACPEVALAQQSSTSDKAFRIATFPDFLPSCRDAFLGAMGDLGWREGHHFILESSGAKVGDTNFDEAAKPVAASMPNLIVVPSTAFALAAHRATKTIPIVMMYSRYPVEAGLADSLGRPGKNVTGNTTYAGTGIWAKLIELLVEVRPQTRRVSVLWTYVPPAFPREEIEPCYAELRNAERSLGVTVHIVETAESEQIPVALAQIEAEQPDALLLTSGVPVNARAPIGQFAVDKRLPTITDIVWTTAVGPYPPLLSYGPVWRELMRNAAEHVGKIMKGAKPGELPIQRPAKFAMTVNLRTAKAIGLTIPPLLLARPMKCLNSVDLHASCCCTCLRQKMALFDCWDRTVTHVRLQSYFHRS
jgi:ABC-type uncharacterized transport system substrate-binding protein